MMVMTYPKEQRLLPPEVGGFHQLFTFTKSQFNSCCSLEITFMTSHISLFIHQQRLEFLSECVGLSLLP